MVLKALLVGVNYLMYKDDALLSPVNNIEIMSDFLKSYLNLQEENLKILSDSEKYKYPATFFSITTILKNMISSSKMNDFIFIYFSGYGNYLGELEKGTDRYLKESMKLSSLYKKKSEDIMFLPQDFNMSCLTKDYFTNVLNNSNSRIFLFFDCVNQTNQLKCKNYYNINKQIYNTHIGKLEKKINSEVIVLYANTILKNFQKFHKVNLINNQIKKFYSSFLISFLKHLFNYLQININFKKYTYMEMYYGILKLLNEYELDFNEIAKNKKTQKQLNTCVSCKNNVIDLTLAFSNDTLINKKFFDNKLNEKSDKEEFDESVNEKMLMRDKTLAYKNVNLGREMKILKRKFENLLNKYNSLNKSVKGNIPHLSFSILK